MLRSWPSSALATVQPALMLMDHVLDRHAHVVEARLAEGRGAADQQDRPHRDARRRHVDQQEGDALLLLGVRIGAHQREDPVGLVGVGGPDLGARHHEVIAVALGLGLERGEVGAGVGLGVALTPADLAATDLRQVLALLLLGAVAQQGRPDHGEPEADERERQAAPGQLLREHLGLAPGRARRRRTRAARWAPSGPWPPRAPARPSCPGWSQVGLRPPQFPPDSPSGMPTIDWGALASSQALSSERNVSMLVHGGSSMGRRLGGEAADSSAKFPPMRVLLANPRGFCAGVDRAIEIVELALERYGPPVYVRHEIVHNRHVVEELRAKGAVFVDDLAEVPAGALLIFSAHGVSPAVRAAAQARDLRVIDATCPLVTKVHVEAAAHGARGHGHRAGRPRGTRRSGRHDGARAGADAPGADRSRTSRRSRCAIPSGSAASRRRRSRSTTRARSSRRSSAASPRSACRARTTSATRPRTARTR